MRQASAGRGTLKYLLCICWGNLQAARRFGDRRGNEVADTQCAFDPMRGTESEASHEGQGHPSGKRGAGLAKVLPLAIAAAVVSALTVAGCTSTHSSQRPAPTASTSQAKPQANCKSPGCAVVRTARSVPQFTAFYGASCSGIHGSWFFNAVEGGGTAALRASYYLTWSFAGGATSAKPSARIHVLRTNTTTVALTLSDGTIKLSGMQKPGTRVTGAGTLVVKLSGTASAPSLTFIETGLRAAEHKLGLRSPFDVGGHPLVVPVQHATSLAGC
jgi:hypothetical protein